MWVVSTSTFTFKASPSCSNLLCAWLAGGLRLHCQRSFWRPTDEVFPVSVVFRVGAWGRTELHACPTCHTPQQNLLPVWWGLLPAGGFCDQQSHLGAAATASGGCLTASECRPGAWGSSGWAPSPSSSLLYIWPCVNCTLPREPSTRTENTSAQLIPHQPREKSGSYSLLLSCKYFQEPHVWYFHHFSLYPHLSWMGKKRWETQKLATLFFCPSKISKYGAQCLHKKAHFYSSMKHIPSIPFYFPS